MKTMEVRVWRGSELAAVFMRNLFDQYTQPENRLTHALLASLAVDSGLLREFIRWAVPESRPRGRLSVLEQALPGAPEDVSGTEEDERKGLPDGWIHDPEGWALLLESKVAAAPDSDQIRRHLRMARFLGFTDIWLLWLTVTPVHHVLARGVVNRTWADLYEWLTVPRRSSEWARRVAQYLEVAEVQADMKQQLQEGTLTRFTGIPFDDEQPYAYSQAKRILGLLRDCLAIRRDLRRQLDADPKHPGRGAIKGKGGTGVWDFLALRDLKGSPIFTRSPHLTLGITKSQLEAYVTVPNGMPGRLRTQLLGKEYEGFAETIHQCTAQLEKALDAVRGANLFFVIVQRRYPSMAAVPILDMKMIFDPRTAFPGGPRRARNRPRFQPEWLRAAYQALRHRKSNLQFQIGAAFPYDFCEAVRKASIAEVVAKTWIACRPVIEAGREKRGGGRKR